MSSRLRPLAIGALEGAAVAALGAAAIFPWLTPGDRHGAGVGLMAAWAASTASVGLLGFKRGAPFEDYLRAFGAGVALRGFVLAALTAATWRQGWRGQSPVLGAYALGVLVLMVLEARHLKPAEKR